MDMQNGIPSSRSGWENMQSTVAMRYARKLCWGNFKTFLRFYL